MTDSKKIIEEIANQIINVQPMPSDTIKKLHEASKTKEELEAEGYNPVSNMGLMWIKDSKNDT